eukprot:6128271-Prymnesium_polylepis.1
MLQESTPGTCQPGSENCHTSTRTDRMRALSVCLHISSRGYTLATYHDKSVVREAFFVSKWCEWLTPRYPTFFYCTNALLGSSGIYASFCHTTSGLDRSRSAGILGQSRM